MRELLEGAGNILQQCADEEIDLGRLENANVLTAMAGELHKLAKSAELRDEAWDAMREVGLAIISRDDWCAYCTAQHRLEDICRKVAETETGENHES